MGTKLRLFVGAVAGTALPAGCLTPGDISAQNDLTAALKAENQIRTTTTGQYTDYIPDLKQVAPVARLGRQADGARRRCDETTLTAGSSA